MLRPATCKQKLSHPLLKGKSCIPIRCHSFATRFAMPSNLSPFGPTVQWSVIGLVTTPQALPSGLPTPTRWVTIFTGRSTLLVREPAVNLQKRTFRMLVSSTLTLTPLVTMQVGQSTLLSLTSSHFSLQLSWRQAVAYKLFGVLTYRRQQRTSRLSIKRLLQSLVGIRLAGMSTVFFVYREQSITPVQQNKPEGVNLHSLSPFTWIPEQPVFSRPSPETSHQRLVNASTSFQITSCSPAVTWCRRQANVCSI